MSLAMAVQGLAVGPPQHPAYKIPSTKTRATGFTLSVWVHQSPYRCVNLIASAVAALRADNNIGADGRPKASDL